MKKLQPVIMALAIIVLMASCTVSSTPQQSLANTESRKGIMDSIASDEAMSKQMMEAMMLTSSGKMAIQDHNDDMMPNHAAMMQKMKSDPAMMKTMMTDMMEACKKDSGMMNGMCMMMMADPQMMKGMEKMKGHDMMKMKVSDTTKMIDHTMHH